MAKLIAIIKSRVIIAAACDRANQLKLSKNMIKDLIRQRKKNTYNAFY
jgi:hypothetical protein